MAAKFEVPIIGDGHRDRVWRDRNGDYWRWYQDDERRGWQYQSPHNRWRFGGMHIPNCGPYVEIARVSEGGWDDSE